MKIFVGGISRNVNEDQLKEVFGKFGEVTSSTIIIDRLTGRPKGFGFVEMSNDEEAKKAIETLNGTELDGRPIGVNVAEERKPRTEGYNGGGKRDFRGRGNNRDNNRDGNRDNNRW